MRINSIQQNQVNCRGGIHFSEVKEYVKTQPFGKIHTKKEWFVNAKKIVDMWPADGMDPFVSGEGYKTFIHTDTNDHVVKTPLKKCLNAWSKAMNAGEGVIIEADNMSLLYGTDAES